MHDDDNLAPQYVWDTGDLECGELLLPLKQRVDELGPDEIIMLVTRQTSAAMDLRAWCRVTGHRLLKSEPPNFYIQRKQA